MIRTKTSNAAYYGVFTMCLVALTTVPATTFTSLNPSLTQIGVIALFLGLGCVTIASVSRSE